MLRATENRHVSATRMNDVSSRSHCIFQLHVESCGEGGCLKSILSICDLAGSERVKTIEVSY